MTASPIIGRAWIAGSWHTTGAGNFASRNPAHTFQIIGQFPIASPAQIDDALESARAAYPAWRRVSRIHRAECFDRLARLIERDTDSLAELMAREVGKPIGECRAEVIEGLHMVQYVFGTGRQAIGEIVASESPRKMRSFAGFLRVLSR